MKSRKYVPSVGSISSGTLLEQDLIDTFYDELRYVAPRGYGAIKREARRYLNSGEDSPIRDDGSEIVNELIDALNECAPPFLYFGSNDGDGACFGWWPCEEQIEDLETFDDTGAAGAAKYYGEFKVVSDHGNVEIYCRMGNGRIKSILGIV